MTENLLQSGESLARCIEDLGRVSVREEVVPYGVDLALYMPGQFYGSRTDISSA